MVLVWCLCPDSCWTFSRFSNISGNVTTVKESTSQHCFENSFDLTDSLKVSQRSMPSGLCGPHCDNLCSSSLPSPWHSSFLGSPSPSSPDQWPLAALSPPLAAFSEMPYFPKFSGLGLTISSLYIVTLLTYMQSTSCEMPDWMKHKLDSILPGEVSTTSEMHMTPPLCQKVKRNYRASWRKWKRRVKKLTWNSTFRKRRSWHPVPSLNGK